VPLALPRVLLLAPLQARPLAPLLAPPRALPLEIRAWHCQAPARPD